jgi:hypothetical protein
MFERSYCNSSKDLIAPTESFYCIARIASFTCILALSSELEIILLSWDSSNGGWGLVENAYIGKISTTAAAKEQLATATDNPIARFIKIRIN